MKTNRYELLAKMESMVNRNGGDSNVTKYIDEWPKTIRQLIYSSETLMIRFGLIERIPDPLYDEEKFTGLEE